MKKIDEAQDNKDSQCSLYQEIKLLKQEMWSICSNTCRINTRTDVAI